MEGLWGYDVRCRVVIVIVSRILLIVQVQYGTVLTTFLLVSTDGSQAGCTMMSVCLPNTKSMKNN